MGWAPLRFAVCEVCGERAHEWGVLFRRFVHNREWAKGKPLHPAGWKVFGHRVVPTNVRYRP